MLRTDRDHSSVRRVGSCIALLAIFVLATSCRAANASSSEHRDPEVTVLESTTTTTSTAPTTTTTRAVAGSQLPPGPRSLHVLGDSVTLGAQTQIPPALPGWNVTFDAKESRRIDQGKDILAARGAPIARVLVIHLCTNWGGGDFRAEAAKVMAATKGVDRVVWVTCVPWLSAVGAADAVIRSLPNDYPNVVIADWAAIAGTAGYTYDDGLHLRTPGAEALAALIASTVGPAPTAS